ncbi:MAG: NAD-dependent epimerase/dehydratase family protein [Nitrospirae bacterium]|nr:NAD-dependent epimerase/dehydratase family protein [Nitrospirota bacterium]
MPTFVTGGTGYIGKQVIRRLANAGGKVHALVRKTGNIKGLAHRNVQLFYGDLEDPESVRDAMKGCQRVYHIAALVKRWHADPQLFDRTNVSASRNLFEIARELQVDKLVYTSTVMAIGPSGGEDLDETHQRVQVFVNDYERTKYLAEKEFYENVEQGLPGVIASPSLVYGPSINYPGSLSNRFIKQFIEGNLKGIPGKGDKKGNGVYIEDVVTGHFLAMDKGKVGEKYILGGENITMNQFIAIMNDEFKMNRKIPRISLPVLWTFGLWDEWKAKMQGWEPEYPRSFAKIYASHWAYSSEKAKRELGYKPRALREGLKITYAWLTGQKLPQPPPSDLVGPNYIPITLN